MKRLALTILALAIAVVLVRGFGEGPAPVAQTNDVATQQFETPAGAGMRVAIDPATGELLEPTADVLAAMPQDLGAALEAPTADPEQVNLVGGGVMVRLNGQFRNYATAQIDDNGNIVAPCVTPSELKTAGIDGAEEE